MLCYDPNSVNLGMRSIWIVVVGEIWSHRNKILFKGEVLNYSEIFSLVQLNVWSRRDTFDFHLHMLEREKVPYLIS